MRLLAWGISIILGTSAAAVACDLPATGDMTKAGFVKPVEGDLIAAFGVMVHPILRYARPHNGIDFAAAIGTPVAAALGGRIAEAKYKGEFGNFILIDHGGGVASSYSHLSRYQAGIEEGACVRTGDVIGFVGNTGLSAGPHLHFQIMNGLNGVRAIDPAPLLGIAVPPQAQGRAMPPPNP